MQINDLSKWYANATDIVDFRISSKGLQTLYVM